MCRGEKKRTRSGKHIIQYIDQYTTQVMRGQPRSMESGRASVQNSRHTPRAQEVVLKASWQVSNRMAMESKSVFVHADDGFVL